MIETSQTIPELVSWAKEREFSLNLPTERFGVFIGNRIYNNERLDGEMLEADLVDIFRHTANAFDQSTDAIALVPIMLSMNWWNSVFLIVSAVNLLKGFLFIVSLH